MTAAMIWPSVSVAICHLRPLIFLPRTQRLLEGIEHAIGPWVAGDALADDPAGEGVDDEGDI